MWFEMNMEEDDSGHPMPPAAPDGRLEIKITESLDFTTSGPPRPYPCVEIRGDRNGLKRLAYQCLALSEASREAVESGVHHHVIDHFFHKSPVELTIYVEELNSAP
jgi:hypothetical protein